MHFASISRFNLHIQDIFVIACESQKISILLPSTVRRYFSNFTPIHSPKTESNQLLFLVSFEPILWLLPKSLQFSTPLSNVSALMKYGLEWPYLEQKGDPLIFVSPSNALSCHLQNPVTVGNIPCCQKPFQNFDLRDDGMGRRTTTSPTIQSINNWVTPTVKRQEMKGAFLKQIYIKKMIIAVRNCYLFLLAVMK